MSQPPNYPDWQLSKEVFTGDLCRVLRASHNRCQFSTCVFGVMLQESEDSFAVGWRMFSLACLVDAEFEEELPLIPLPSEVSAPFPVEVFPTPLRRFVEEGARSIFCPADFLAVPLLVLAGAAIGTSRVLQIKPGWCEGPRMYAAIVADPGSRKSPALDVVLSPFRKQQQQKQAAYQQELERYQREQGLSESLLHEPKGLHMEQVITTDSTLEALTEVLEQNPRGLLFFRDELTGWVLSMNQYKGGRGADRQAWLSFWNGAQVIVNRKSRKVPLILDNQGVRQPVVSAHVEWDEKDPSQRTEAGGHQVNAVASR